MIIPYFIDSIDQFWIWNCQKISKVLATSAGNQNYSINSYYSTKNYFPWKLENKWTRNSDRRRCGPQLHNQKCWKWNMNIFIQFADEKQQICFVAKYSDQYWMSLSGLTAEILRYHGTKEQSNVHFILSMKAILIELLSKCGIALNINSIQSPWPGVEQ